VIVTDRGSEFTDPLGIEFNGNGERRTRVFYCDQGILTVKEAEQLVGRLVVQLFSCVGIDVTHQKRHISAEKIN